MRAFAHRPVGTRPPAFRIGAASTATAWLCATLLTGCAGLPSPLPAWHGEPAAAAVTGDDLIIVAVADTPEPRPSPGSAPRAGYGRSAGYAGSDQALALADAVATAHGLNELKAWTIQALNWRCMLYRLPPGSGPSQRQAVLERLGSDPRVRLAQPLNSFETLAEPLPSAPARPGPYNDPYLPLQSGFAAIDAAGAQRVTRGEGTKVAIIDTGIDSAHPDLQGRILVTRDFVGRGAADERHGTEVAGVIAATANNGVGIVGVAPGTQLLSFRSCWAVGVGTAARCNSFTLAQGLSAAMVAGVSVINLSLGGPRDPLLEQLAQLAMAQGIVIVGAMPAGGQRAGFPTALPGVLAVMVSEDGPPGPSAGPAADSSAGAGRLAAPGQRILTLAPGGGYDYASGSSLAAAHVSGAVALLRSVDASLDGPALARLLRGEASSNINACRALHRMDARLAQACVGTR